MTYSEGMNVDLLVRDYLNSVGSTLGSVTSYQTFFQEAMGLKPGLDPDHYDTSELVVSLLCLVIREDLFDRVDPAGQEIPLADAIKKLNIMAEHYELPELLLTDLDPLDDDLWELIHENPDSLDPLARKILAEETPDSVARYEQAAGMVIGYFSDLPKDEDED